jgi:hypothetical protein
MAKAFIFIHYSFTSLNKDSKSKIVNELNSKDEKEMFGCGPERVAIMQRLNQAYLQIALYPETRSGQKPLPLLKK